VSTPLLQGSYPSGLCLPYYDRCARGRLQWVNGASTLVCRAHGFMGRWPGVSRGANEAPGMARASSSARSRGTSGTRGTRGTRGSAWPHGTVVGNGASVSEPLAPSVAPFPGYTRTIWL